MKGVERMDAVMVCPQQRVEFIQRNLYAMNVNKKERRNCYSCRGFGYLARNYRNKKTEHRIGKERRLEYRGNNGQNNLKEKGDLIVFD